MTKHPFTLTIVRMAAQIVVTFILTFFITMNAEARLPGIDLRFKRFELLAGMGLGQYSAKDPYYNVDFKTTPALYGIGFYGGNMDHAWSLTATRGSFILQGRPRQSFTTLATYSRRLGLINEKQNYYFIGYTLRSLTFSRDLTLDGVNLSSTYVTQVSPGIIISNQTHWTRSVLFFTQLMIDIPVYATAPATTEQFSQIGAGLNGGIMAETSQHTGVGAELQLRLDQSSTMNGADKTYATMFEASFLMHFLYLF